MDPDIGDLSEDSELNLHGQVEQICRRVPSADSFNSGQE